MSELTAEAHQPGIDYAEFGTGVGPQAVCRSRGIDPSDPEGLGAFLAWRKANTEVNPYPTSVIYDGQPVLGRRWGDDTRCPATKFGLAIIANGYAQWLEEVPEWVADALCLFAEFLEDQRTPPGAGLAFLDIPDTIIVPGERSGD